ncbi:glycan-binding surface protein [Muricauda sp. ANG21]|uniref:glycan-binding surface protein n=1 Tax=Allomuricauda sp. ANG21 TaxID=3042468 RepID=UPI003451DD32
MRYFEHKGIKGLLLVGLAILSLYSCDEDDEVFPQSDSPNQNIVEILASSLETSTLLGALEQSDLDATLANNTTFTVFAPVNAAFSGVDLSTMTEAQQRNTLLNHVWSTTTADLSANLQTGYRTTMATGVDGLNLSFFTNTEGSITFNGVASPVQGQFDLGATNGVVHMVDNLLLPPTVVDHVAANPEYTSLATAITQAELVETLEGDGPFTIFAPNNAAFEMLLAQLEAAFGYATLADVPNDILEEVLLYHVIVGSNVVSDDVDGTTFETAQGESFSAAGTTIDDASYIDAEINLTDVQSINGIMHGVDKVLLPDAVFQQVLGATLDLVARSEDKGYTSFLAAVELAGLTESLTADNLTVFVPNNDAFAALFSAIDNFNALEDFDTPEEIETLKKLLEYHLYAGSLVESQLTDGSSVTTVLGDSFDVSVSDAIRLRPSFSDAIPSQVVDANIGATNGIIHEVNRVLIPEELLDALGIEVAPNCDLHPVGDTNLVFFDWDANGEWWGNVAAENDPSVSLDGSSYGRANFQTGGTGWQDLFWRNDPTTFHGAATVGSNLDDYVLKFDINTIEPISDGMFRIRFNDADGVDAFYDWAPWDDTGEPFDTGGWQTVEIPLSALGVPDFSLVDSEFGMAFEGADVLLNFAIDNVRFDAPGYECGGPDEVDDPALVFFDWDANGAWWGNVAAENDPSITLDGSSYGRANFQTGGTGWQDLFWRNDPTTFHGAATVGSNLDDYVLKFDLNTIEPLSAGMFRIRFNDADGVDAFYDWAPWTDTGEPLDTGGWTTIEIPLTELGVPDFSLVDSEFGMAFEGADVLLNFAIDNVRFEEKQ